MSVHSSHDLAEEFPEHAERIRSLVLVDGKFSKAVQSYGEVNLEILRIENELETASDEHLETLKKKRLHHLDIIQQALQPIEHTGT
ncbi:YdcH family protein [Pinisolibacter aquiterrae]|jgi:uncharacterized protein YdcH (DUF465 family)|uniref:YdcH family protein n=1 Tax=Pinisolibacter aquiterrae TaxID=2815579 RepID=UPI001C3DCA66|nr:DUF465 domain-containing protein [Pinisolibacter aquiterrae]MBV5263168.1 DUF465 domain-containing protein [Pinisolibacter aquiterrae]MCC8234082.1 DUF465 domain-containing protein [Pinisolibacter aquiterrae]